MAAPAERFTLTDEEFLTLERARATARLKLKESGVGRRFAAGTSRGVAKTVGAPVDIANAMLNLIGAGSEAPLGGSANIQSAFETLGVGVPEEEELGRAGRVGELVGTTAAISPGIVSGGLKSVTTATTEVARKPKIFLELIRDIGRSFNRNPVTFVTAETASAAGAGLVGFEAMQRFPDSAAAQAFGEILGGFSPALLSGGSRLAVFLADKAPGTGFVLRKMREAVKAVSTSAQTRRSIARVQRSVSDPGASTARIGRTDIIEDSGLTAAQKASDPGLLALERAVFEQDEILAQRFNEQIAGVNANIRQALIPEAAGTVPTRQVKAYLTGLMDARIAQAAGNAEKQLAKLGATATREDLNRLARQELDNAKSAARAQERELYALIPDDARIPTEASREALNDFMLNTSSAQQEDISALAKKLLLPGKTVKGKTVKNPKYLGEVTDINEMRGLSSKLREDARVARANNKFNEARIADELADSISDDIANAIGGAEVRESVDVATSFSRDLNDRFTRGPVGALLKAERAGGVKTDPGLTLETTVGKRGPRAKVETDALLRAVERHGDEAVMREHIEGFLIDDFRRQAVREGRVDPQAAQRWLDDNQDVLGRFPELQREINATRTAGGSLVDAERLVDPKLSRAAIFINAPPGQEIKRILRTAEPKKAMQELVRLARQDRKGLAEQGLKAGFFEHILQESSIGTLDVNDLPFVSGAQMTRVFQRDEIIEGAKGLLTRKEINRLNKVRETAVLLDRVRKSGRPAEGIIGDQPNMLFGILGRIGGAQLGRVIARQTGGGTVQTPGILSAQVQKLLLAGVQDPAKRLLTDALTSETDELFRAMLLPLNKPANVQFVRARVNAWAVGVLREQHAIEDEKE